ncbi:serpin A12 isoform X2 [Ornithorhynchus anatinus]|uniref:serpin A12 isoform X2 n=1 Tax=Ornithorhynchus anatinus TaxID=9258 RepID=UPI0010A7FCBB|nr:serpin A12 isoform X2 [Ornithorhynchus anatinus]
MKSAPWTHLLLTLFLLEEGCCQQLAPPTGNLREGSRAISPPGRDLGGGKRASIQLVPHNSAFAFDLFRKVASCSSAARDQINGYVDQKTQGKIPDLIGNLDSESALVLASYIFFQAQWEKKFDPRQTQEDDFFLTEDKSIKVPMMYRGGMYRYGYDDQLSCTILEMPYKGNATGLFILPDERNLERVEAELQKDTVARWKKLITRRSIDVSLPKFSISGTYDLKPLLYKMGIMKVFTEYGELSKIAAQHSLKLTKAVHKAVLKIDEKGTEGAAGSSVEAMPMIMPSLVKFNQPFLVIITDDFTDSILFLGKVANPAGK